MYRYNPPKKSANPGQKLARVQYFPCKFAPVLINFHNPPAALLAHKPVVDILLPGAILLDAMQKKCEVTLEMAGRGNSGSTEKQVVPLRIFISVQNGRQYLMAGFNGNIFGFRLDRILVVKEGDICGEFERLRAALDRMQQNMWGVSVAQYCEREDTAVSSDLVLESVEFTIWYGTGQEYIHNRLVREKRCGRGVFQKMPVP